MGDSLEIAGISINYTRLHQSLIIFTAHSVQVCRNWQRNILTLRLPLVDSHRHRQTRIGGLREATTNHYTPQTATSASSTANTTLAN